MAKHLVNCVKCPITLRSEVSEMIPSEQNTLMQNSNHYRDVSSASTSLPPSNSSLKICDDYKDSLEEKLARAIIVSGAPFSMVEHPLWQQFFEELNPSFKLPNRKTISSKYLNKIYDETSKNITEQVKTASYMHLQCDGWSNVRSEGVINFLISKPEMVFVRSLATEDNKHTSAYIADEIIKVMNVYGEHKFIALTGDNAGNMQGAFKEVQKVYPQVVPLGCVAHCLNLLSEDFIKCPTVKNYFLLVIDIIKTIKYSKVLSWTFAKICKGKGSGEQLKLPVKTRCGSYATSLKSLVNSEVSLQALAVHEKITLSPTTKSSLLSEDFWNTLDINLQLFQPIAEWTTFFE
ncbi:uncharacterized protein [Musca autumnalis]|uniref:uncharacterized protein n=1 Tax=Musca autumnalis TaxID=221902 RepID=UPI003CF54546